MIEGLLCIYGLITTLTVLTFFVMWIRNYGEMKQFANYGWVLGVGFVLFDLSAILFQVVTLSSSTQVLLVFLGSVFTTLRIALFTVAGIYFCIKIDVRSFAWYPVKSQRSVEIESETTLLTKPEIAADFESDHPGDKLEVEQISEIAETIIAETIATEPSKLDEPNVDITTLHSPPSYSLVEPQHLTTSASSIALIVVSAIAYTFLLFWATSPRLAISLQSNILLGPDGSTQESITLLTLMFVAEAAFFEEIFFRLGFQNFLAYTFEWHTEKYWVAIIGASLVWTLGHVAVLDPTWVKLIQVFPLGIALGWMFKKYGIESSIITHVVFNVVMALLSPFLLTA